ncbi:four-carbon acid sugar kinase family protein [Streptomyces lonarensis]|uniref:Four-carbon acid sugar kinase family protein n=1 Tax=Streptomyces lonarensis TaxID=700599 RepID=A0A7X6D3B5_9ACTN|nr:four-carbon acid sugar kinase family protein [Streptomyces lonarensis]NJQ07431.1 four-carbon acid sugar kinase family protein [Streptomyces lonarensis]
MTRAFVVADDLTGANDTGVQFALAGWSTTLRLGAEGTGPRRAAGQATAVSTDSRALDHDGAATATRTAVAAERLAADDHLYLKTDSTLRGSVAAQIAGALAAAPDGAVVVLAPAYPAMGRTVHEGRLLVHGESVTLSPAGRDPVTPVTTDLLTELVPGAVPVPVAPTAAAWARAIDAASRHGAVVAADAGTDAELARLAEAIVLLGPRAVPAGSAGLAAPLAALWRTDGTPPDHAAEPPAALRPLVLVSSHHLVARDQVAAAERADTTATVVRTTTDALLRGEAPAPAAGEGPVILLSPDERARPGHSAQLAAALAGHAAHLLADADHGDHPFDAVVLVGGDGAEAFLTAVGAHGIAVRGTLLEGVPDGRVAGGTRDGLAVVTKAGGFGDDTTLTLLLRALRTPTRTETSR